MVANSLDDPSELSNNEIPSIDVPMKQNCDCMKTITIKKEVVGKNKVSLHGDCQNETVMVDDETLNDGSEDTEEIIEEDTAEVKSFEEDLLLEDVVEVVEEIEKAEPKQTKFKGEKLQAPEKVIKQKYKTNVDESIETIEQLMMDTIEEPTKHVNLKKNSKSSIVNKLNTKSGKVSEKKMQKPKSSSEKLITNKKTSKSSGKYTKNSANTNKNNKQKTMKTNEKSKKSNKSKKTKSKKNEL